MGERGREGEVVFSAGAENIYMSMSTDIRTNAETHTPSGSQEMTVSHAVRWGRGCAG